ncbi:transcription factor HES-4-A-like [Physella acuta]|uniref:transcription factor HES-4-A-like n=1 Tax=Physella acuta TaxID=109671 RepID=UPI0027DB4CB4|nr:transcription factor HES-4-A-like [Physella acuta]
MDNLPNVCEATSQSHDLDNYTPTHRKGKKLLAEKKRRARINNCLMQIRDIVCEGDEEKDTDLDKMEKAEILEKTLEVLTRLRHDYSKTQTTNTFSTRRAMAVRYASGFSSCAEESIRYIQSSRLVPAEVKVQLQNHLRTIARRMETVVQVDDPNTNFTSPFHASASTVSSTSPSLSDIYVRDRAIAGEEQAIHQTSTTDARHVYIPSPIQSSTPALQYNITHSTTAPLPHLQEERIIPSPDSLPKQDPTKRSPGLRCVEKFYTECPHTTTEISKSPFHYKPQSDIHSLRKYEAVTPDFTSEHSLNSYPSLPADQPYQSTVLSMTAYTPSVSSPVLIHPASYPYTSSLDSQVYGYRGYEPYPSTAISLVQPARYVTPTLTNSPSPLSSKQSNTSNSALNLCVKGGVDHQISPETMWRPW